MPVFVGTTVVRDSRALYVANCSPSLILDFRETGSLVRADMHLSAFFPA